MGQFLSYSVEVLDAHHSTPHRIADFARLQAAIKACKLALQDERTTLALVKDRDGVMVYCADNRAREWTQSADIRRHGHAESDSSGSGGTRQPEPENHASEPPLSAYRREGLTLLILFLLSAWIEVPV